jgi:serine/threonine protein kinase
MDFQFSGTKRFKVLRKLGEGGMGAVYECRDQETGLEVALKTLPFSAASTLLQFKDEFRQFQGIHHQNLVSLGELFEEEGRWHFTMELVRGVDFMAHVRNDPSSPIRLATPTADTVSSFDNSMAKGFGGSLANTDALRATLTQLARGLSALHEAGKVHRDVKPSNILVTKDGRVVLLDFGIATDISRSEQLSRSQIVGTPHYMAPEQAAAVPVTPAADWYAVGAMLYEALTGCLPLEGTLLQILEEKQWRQPRDPREIDAGIPDDLATLALKLLAIRPEDRPTAADVLKLLGDTTPHSAPSAISVSHTDQQSPFVGREAELAALETCWESVNHGRTAAAVYVHGESGVGKSALVNRFADAVRAEDSSGVVLAGACYEHEAVPYKAIDGVVDALSRYLARAPAATAAALLPRHAAALAHAFPVLWRVEAFAASPRPRVQVDPVEQRSRVFSSLRELLTRLADRSPLLICIDDLQWADADSLALLGEILRPPDSPALLVVATVRANTENERLHLPIGPAALPSGGTVLNLGRLPDARAREIAETLTRRVGPNKKLDIDAMVREAQGYPLFLQELVRYHAVARDPSFKPVALEDALWSRIDALDESTQRLLHVTALAPAGIMQGTATRAAGIEGAEAIRHIKHLKVAHLVRTTGGTRATDFIEPYHGRVRDAIRARLPQGVARSLHRRLALAMETGGVLEYEELALHWHEAGEPERAAECARRAALRAEEALAFDRAAAYYRMVDELITLPTAERRELLVRLGDALANGGRSQEAAKVFSEAAKGANPREARDLARRAAEHLLRSGHMNEGLEQLRRVLQTVDVSYPETARQAIASIVWSKTKLAFRGLGFDMVDESSASSEMLARVDACWAATTGLFVADALRGADFHLRHLLLALSVGEPHRVIRGLAFHSINYVIGGHKYRADAMKVLERARALSDQYPSAYGQAFLPLSEATIAYLSGDWLDAIRHSRAAIDQFRSTCRGVSWELATARQLIFWSLAHTGSVSELAHLAYPNLREILEASDHYAAMSIRTGLPNNVIWLAQDDAVGARREADQAIAVWSNSDAFLQHLMNVYAQTGIDLYEGKVKDAFERAMAERKRLADAGIGRVELDRIHLNDVATRASLAAAASAPPDERHVYLEAARRDVAAMLKEKAPWGRALASAHRAALLRLEGHEDAKAAAGRAVAELRSSHLDLHASTCAFAAGLDDTDAQTFFTQQGIKRPERFARVFSPGW